MLLLHPQGLDCFQLNVVHMPKWHILGTIVRNISDFCILPSTPLSPFARTVRGGFLHQLHQDHFTIHPSGSGQNGLTETQMSLCHCPAEILWRCSEVYSIKSRLFTIFLNKTFSNYLSVFTLDGTLFAAPWPLISVFLTQVGPPSLLKVFSRTSGLRPGAKVLKH